MQKSSLKATTKELFTAFSNLSDEAKEVDNPIKVLTASQKKAAAASREMAASQKERNQRHHV